MSEPRRAVIAPYRKRLSDLSAAFPGFEVVRFRVCIGAPLPWDVVVVLHDGEESDSPQRGRNIDWLNEVVPLRLSRTGRVVWLA